VSTKQVESIKQYAIFQTGGKQYQAVIGKTLAVEKLEGQSGDAISFDQVMLVKRDHDQYEFGQPFVKDGAIKASIVKQTKGPKIVVFKFKRRKKYRVKTGHRQPITVVRFESF